jgi:hypothetical protein
MGVQVGAEQQLRARHQFIRAYPVLGRAVSLRECLQDMLVIGEEEVRQWWCG